MEGNYNISHWPAAICIVRVYTCFSLNSKMLSVNVGVMTTFVRIYVSYFLKL